MNYNLAKVQVSDDIIVVSSSVLKQKSEMIPLDRDGSMRAAEMERGSGRIRARAGGRGEIGKKQEENG